MRQAFAAEASKLAHKVFSAASVAGNLASGQVMDRGHPRWGYVAGFIGASLGAGALALIAAGPATFAVVLLMSFCIIIAPSSLRSR